MDKKRKRSKPSVKESKAILIFKNQINIEYVDASDIRENDKVADSDGFINIFDKESFSVGKLEVQVKGRSNLKNSIQFSNRLLEYSKEISTPFLLIIVDIDKQIVYWEHISKEKIPNERVNITGKKNLSFDLLQMERIADDTYIQKWLDIAKEYQERIQKYPQIKKDFEELIKTTTKKIPLPHDTIIFFQQYIDKVNSLLENNFYFIKEILFKNTWKIGVAVLHSETYLGLGLYTIPYGTVDSIIQEIDPGKWNNQNGNGYFSGALMPKNHKKSDTLAKEFIIDYFKRILENNDLPLISDKLIEEYLYTATLSICASLGLEEKKVIA